MSAQNPLLEVRHLRVEFPTRRGTLVALDDVSFTISAGEVLGVVGESGAGKSMTGPRSSACWNRPDALPRVRSFWMEGALITCAMRICAAFAARTLARFFRTR